MLCQSFIFGMGVICQPSFVSQATEYSSGRPALQVFHVGFTMTARRGSIPKRFPKEVPPDSTRSLK